MASDFLSNVLHDSQLWARSSISLNAACSSKIITGDNHLVARHFAEAISMPPGGLLTGKELNGMGDEALWHAAQGTSIVVIGAANLGTPCAPLWRAERG